MNTLPPEFVARGERIAGRLEIARRLHWLASEGDPDFADLERDVALAEVKLTIWLEDASAMSGDDESIETASWSYRLVGGQLRGHWLDDPRTAERRLASCTH